MDMFRKLSESGKCRANFPFTHFNPNLEIAKEFKFIIFNFKKEDVTLGQQKLRFLGSLR